MTTKRRSGPLGRAQIGGFLLSSLSKEHGIPYATLYARVQRGETDVARLVRSPRRYAATIRGPRKVAFSVVREVYDLLVHKWANSVIVPSMLQRSLPSAPVGEISQALAYLTRQQVVQRGFVRGSFNIPPDLMPLLTPQKERAPAAVAVARGRAPTLYAVDAEGVRLPLMDWAKRLRLPYRTLYNRRRRYGREDDARIFARVLSRAPVSEPEALGRLEQAMRLEPGVVWTVPKLVAAGVGLVPTRVRRLLDLLAWRGVVTTDGVNYAWVPPVERRNVAMPQLDKVDVAAEARRRLLLRGFRG